VLTNVILMHGEEADEQLHVIGGWEMKMMTEMAGAVHRCIMRAYMSVQENKPSHSWHETRKISVQKNERRNSYKKDKNLNRLFPLNSPHKRQY